MKQFKGYSDAKASAEAGSSRLPAGAYVCKVLGVKYEDGTDGNSDRIAIQFDIAEGPHKDFFKKQYEANQSEDKKWKGATRIYVPADDGSERDGWSKKSFASWTSSFEKSNTGYAWDWDEKKWKGLSVGIVFGDTGSVIDTDDGKKDIVYTEARFPVEVSKVRDGSAPAAKFKAKNGYPSAQTDNTALSGFANISADITEEEIPF